MGRKKYKRFFAYHTPETIEFLRQKSNIEICDCATPTEFERLLVERAIRDLKSNNHLCLNRNKVTDRT